MDLWEKCFDIVDKTLKLSNLKKEDINEIVLVGGSTRTPKIQEMVKKYFNGKEPLKTVNVDEIIAHGAALFPYLKDITINDILTNAIGISVGNRIFDIIIPIGTVFPLRKGFLLKYIKKYKIAKGNNLKIDIYEGNDKSVENNNFLGSINLMLNNDKKENNLEISMMIDETFTLNTIIKLSDKEIAKMQINLNINQ